MRVLQCYNILGALTERVWLEVPQRLASRGFTPQWMCESIAPECPPLDPPPVLVDRIAVAGDDDVPLQMAKIAMRAIDKRIARDIALAHGHTGPRLLQMASLARAGVPCLISLYGYDASRLLRDPAWGARYRWAAEVGMTFVVLCHAMRQRLLHEGVPDSAIETIHLGIDPAQWAYDPFPALSRGRFVFVGRLQEKKGVEYLLRAMSLLTGQGGTLDIVGDGPLHESLHEVAAALGVNDRVRFHGRVDRSAVGAILRGATAFILPSVEATDGDSEGTPIVLMEALAMGLPCITTDHSGNPEVLPPSGRVNVVPPNSPEALASAMERMMSMDAAQRRSLQDAGRAWVETEFNLDRTVDHYAALYARLVGRRDQPMSSLTTPR